MSEPVPTQEDVTLASTWHCLSKNQQETLAREFARVRAEERAACAQLAEACPSATSCPCRKSVGDAVRARGGP